MVDMVDIEWNTAQKRSAEGSASKHSVTWIGGSVNNLNQGEAG
jgi:hypothetical protein